MGASLLGLQLELDNFKCENDKLIEDSIDSKSVERTVISTYGSFIAESLAEWSKQVISLVQASSFSPRYVWLNHFETTTKNFLSIEFQFGLFEFRAIRRDLKSHIDLFVPYNFDDDLTNEMGELINVTLVKEWMTPLMANYCNIFEIDCNES